MWQCVKTLYPLVNIKIAGKWMFIPLKMVLIGIDPYPCRIHPIDGNSNIYRWLICPSYLHGIRGFPSNVWWFPAKSHQNIPKKKIPKQSSTKIIKENDLQKSTQITKKNISKHQTNIKNHQQKHIILLGPWHDLIVVPHLRDDVERALGRWEFNHQLLMWFNRLLVGI